MDPKRLLRLSALLLFSAGIYACAGGDDDDGPTDSGVTMDSGPVDTGVPDVGPKDTGTNDAGSGCDVDTTPPTVMSTPASPVEIPSGQTTASVTLQFSEEVTGLDTGVTIDNGATITGVTDLGSNMFEVQIGSLADDTSYTLTVASSIVADVCANNLAQDFQVTINVRGDPCATDMTGPTVTATPPSPIILPAGSTTASVTLSFDEPVLGVDAAGLMIDNGASIDSVTATGVANDYAVQVSGLQDGTTNLTVPVSVTDQCGNALASPEVIAFVTDVDPPMVTGTVPFNGAVDVARTASITIDFSESIAVATASITVDANGPIGFTTQWNNNDTQVVLTPLMDLPFTTNVIVTVAGAEDLAGNAMPTFYLGFLTVTCPFGNQPPIVMVDTSTKNVGYGGTGNAQVPIVLTGAYPLVESDVSVVATNGGSGTLVAGSLSATGTTAAAADQWTFAMANIAEGDTYQVQIAGASNVCGDLVAGAFPIVIVGAPVASGSCPFPLTLAQHHTGVDGCDQGTNSTLATSEATGFTLTNQGDAFSLQAIYDSDSIGGSDNDFFSFDVVEDGVTIRDIQVSLAYGCNFQGTGTPGAYAPIIEVLDDTGATVGTFNGNQDYDVINGSGNFGFGMGSVALTGPAGTNTYHLWIDDDVGTNWCMDYIYYVELVDTTRLIICEGAQATSDLALASADVFNAAGTAAVPITLTSNFQLEEGDLTLTQISGTGAGTIQAGSLTGGPTNWTVDVTGVATGDVYEIAIAGGRTDVCGTTIQPGVVTVGIVDTIQSPGPCPMPVLANHYTGVDACDQGTNSTLATSESTGFTLQNIGDTFSIGATYDSDSIGGSDNDYFSFQVAENGTTISDIEVSLAYGCNFQGTGTPGPYAPIVDIRDNNDNEVATFNGQNDYDVVNGSGSYGFGNGTAEIAGPAGTNTYHLWIDDDVGSNWCMDYVYHVRLVDNTRPAACAGVTPGTTDLVATTLTTSPDAFGNAAFLLEFTTPYDGLAEADLTITPVTGTGTLIPGSLQRIGNTYTASIANVAVGDSYTVTIAGTTDICGVTYAGGTATVGVVGYPTMAGTCPLPTATSHFAAPDACGVSTYGDLATAAATGFTLTNPGDLFSIGGIYDTDAIGGSDFDYFAFDLVADGVSTYNVTVNLVYGCAFDTTGGGTPGASAPDLDLRTAADVVINDVGGNDDYSDVNGSGLYGFGGNLISIPPADAPAGTNTYYLRLDDVSGSGWCMDYSIFVELTSVQ